MKKLIMIAALLMSIAAVAQTGVTTSAQLGTYLWTIHDADPFIQTLIINYGDSADSMVQSFQVSDLGQLQVTEIEGQTIGVNEVAYVIPLLAENTPFTKGQTVFLSVSPAYVINSEVVQSANPSKTVEAFLLNLPNPPKRIGIQRR